ncbi:xanthine dehydrogenase family protein molybdopterin-binding subunit [Streptomyces sp. SP18BB07]|uniref:xanthine dehydrogenase family protein molybdopterin-binding subunit n=1 Tax=Streptomyces sp. SP18BB07 TaxID=3002522 RepID=UPI002E7718C5|nr:xanthine dehydrogenase family protein molybdopterin-binding subunit [Streptomyces sp. SP18BB07]MEE1758564.1 xanthine dehydrogenase family protein molybdopterin-binding subunit [Streptomyces sp. SP18BB07]
MTTTVEPSAPAGTTEQPGIGNDRMRVDAPAKVTGTAPYAYEQPVEEPLYLVPILSTIARGRIAEIDDAACRALPGVRLVLTHANAPQIRVRTDAALVILQSTEVHYRGEFIGAVVADSPQVAREGAGLVQVTYDEQPAELGFVIDDPRATVPRRVNAFKHGSYERGDADAGLQRGRLVEADYSLPMEFHAPIEPNAVTAIWHDVSALHPRTTRLTLYDANHGTGLHNSLLAPVLGLLPGQLEVISPYIGGSFGAKGFPHPHLVLVSMAARLLPGRPVKYAMTRQQMFRSSGNRPASKQRIRLSVEDDGRLVAIDHQSWAPTSRLKTYIDQTVSATRMMYDVPHLRTIHHVVTQDAAPGIFMRAPGEFSGMFALETALDEAAHAIGIDPIELRVRNEPSTDPETGKPFSTRNLLACLREGAEQFGWADLQPVGTRRDGEWLVGLGVASATYPNVHFVPNRAGIRYSDGRWSVEMQASDIGTGAWTILPQIAADTLGVPVDRVDAEIGRTGLPWAMIAGGSNGTYDWGDAVVAAATKFRRKHGDSPKEGAYETAAGRLPRGARGYSRHSFGAHFAQVRVSTVTGEIRVDRMVGAFAAGQIINPRTARSQLIGGMTMGLSAALHEEGHLDERFGHVVNGDLAGYHVAAHADVVGLEAFTIEEHDPWFGRTGAKGIGELGIVGAPAAIGNAVFNATGVRLRDLPFTPDRLIMAWEARSSG